MKRLFLLLSVFFLVGATYDHSVQISTGQTVIDSVIAYIETDNTKLDSAKWFSFPVDSFITVPDTAPLVLEYRFYYKIDSASGTYRTTSELLSAHIITSVSGADASFTYIAVDTSNGADTTIQGVSVSAYNLSDQRIAAGTTDGNGQVVFGFKENDTVYFNNTQPVGWIWEQRDTSFAVQNGGVDTAKGYRFIPTAVTAGKTAVVSVFVTNNDRTPAVNVMVSAYLSRNKVVDSAGYAVYNQTQTVPTDSLGMAQFTCIWSSYMIPATDWWFSTSLPGAIKKKITIGREATITLDLR